MANTKISALTDGTTAEATDKIPVERSGANRYVTPGYIKTYLGIAGTLSIASGKTFTASNTLTLTGTDGSTLNVGTGGTLGALATTTAGTGVATAAAAAVNGTGGFITYSTYAPASGKTLTVSNSITLAGTDSTTMTFPSTSATIARTDAANTFTGSQTLTGGTVTASTPVLDMTQTWNSGAVTFTGVKVNVTSTAAGSDSMLIDMQVGGSTKFRVRSTGQIFSDVGQLASSSGYQFNSGNTNDLRGISASNVYGTRFGLMTGVTSDTYIERDAANVIAQRNSTTAQTFRVYNTYTDSSNYQRLTHAWNTSTALIHNEGAGTGADGSIAFNDAALATNATKGFIMIPSCAGAPTGVPADIPTGQIPIVFDSTNNKLYVYDGGWISTAALT